MRFLNNVTLKDHQSTESLMEKTNMLSVNRINAQTKITEVWKALKKDKKVTHLKTVHQRSQMKKDNQGQCPKDSLSLMVTQLAQLTISSMMEKSVESLS